MTRVLVVAAFPSMRAGLSAVVRTAPDLAVVGEAADPADLRDQVVALQPEVVLLELVAADDEAATSLWHLAQEFPRTGVVLLGDVSGRHWIGEVLRAGVRGYLPRDAAAEEIVAAVRAAGQGLIALHPRTLATLLPTADALPGIPATEGPAEALTARETEVLRLLSEGLGNKAIALRLHISEHTVKFHVGAIMAKLGAGSRTEAVSLAARRGMIML